MKTLLVLLLPLLVVTSSCSNRRQREQQRIAAEAAAADSAQAAAPAKNLQMPDIPPMLDTPEARMDYLAAHYWMNLDFNDTVDIKRPEYGEQAWVDYIHVLEMMPNSKAGDILERFFRRAGENKTVYHFFTGMADKYLYDPNSPMRNEELYISVLDAMLEGNVLTDAEKIRPRDRRVMAEKNRRGTQALNFTYTTVDGASGTLYGTAADYTLLFINNPGCHACRETIEALKQAPHINRLLQTGNLKILAVYPDEDRTEWEKHLPDFPETWLNGYDRSLTMKSKNLYDLKAIPTLYLMDSNKYVLLKDANVVDIENYLGNRS
ncbi:MAG: DUF5106 domain-containing protein [Prevotellaceae bacterium]|jgi:hypothetical protein|nr:DUF5106 domain-containing protein [Prevotellaceae bacterium]